MLIKARKWIRDTFEEGSRPTLRQVEAWIEAGELRGMKIGDQVYVHSSFATVTPLTVKQPPAEPELKKPRMNLIDRR